MSESQGRVYSNRKGCVEGFEHISYFVSQPGATPHDLTSVKTRVQFKVIRLVNSDLMD